MKEGKISYINFELSLHGVIDNAEDFMRNLKHYLNLKYESEFKDDIEIEILSHTGECLHVYGKDNLQCL